MEKFGRIVAYYDNSVGVPQIGLFVGYEAYGTNWTFYPNQCIADGMDKNGIRYLEGDLGFIGGIPAILAN